MTQSGTLQNTYRIITCTCSDYRHRQWGWWWRPSDESSSSVITTMRQEKEMMPGRGRTRDVTRFSCRVWVHLRGLTWSPVARSCRSIRAASTQLNVMTSREALLKWSFLFPRPLLRPPLPPSFPLHHCFRIFYPSSTSQLLVFLTTTSSSSPLLFLETLYIYRSLFYRISSTAVGTSNT